MSSTRYRLHVYILYKICSSIEACTERWRLGSVKALSPGLDRSIASGRFSFRVPDAIFNVLESPLNFTKITPHIMELSGALVGMQMSCTSLGSGVGVQEYRSVGLSCHVGVAYCLLFVIRFDIRKYRGQERQAQLLQLSFWSRSINASDKIWACVIAQYW